MDSSEEEEGPSSPPVGPPATGERADRQQAAPGTELPNAPELKEAPSEKEEEGATDKEAPDQGAAREREDDES